MKKQVYSASMIKRLLTYVLFATAAILSAQEGQAAINATSSTKNVAINRTASIQVTWQITVIPATPTQVTSTQADFGPVPAGPLFLRVPKSISGLAVPPTRFSNSAFLTLSETVLIPASVIAKARAAGVKQIIYERTFTPGGKGGVILNITGSGSAGFSISREALSFTDE